MSFYDDVRKRFPLQLEALEKAVQENKIAHAYLIKSEIPSDRNDFAVALAQLASCPNSKNGAPCTVCRICRTIENGTYSGLVKVTPEGKAYQIKVGEPENPQENSIRYFTSTFSLTNIDSAKKKTGIIYDADRMNAEAQNALLKTLEEPPPESLIMLVTGNAGILLPTTISRCRAITLPAKHIDFDFAGADKLYPLLFDAFNAQDGQTLERTAAAIIDIASSLKEEAEKENEARWLDKINAVKEIDERIAKKMTKSMEDSGAGLYIGKRKLFLQAIQCFYSQLFMISQGISVQNLPNPEFFDNIQLNASTDPDKALRAVELAEKMNAAFFYAVNEPLAIRSFIFNINTES